MWKKSPFSMKLAIYICSSLICFHGSMWSLDTESLSFQWLLNLTLFPSWQHLCDWWLMWFFDLFCSLYFFLLLYVAQAPQCILQSNISLSLRKSDPTKVVHLVSQFIWQETHSLNLIGSFWHFCSWWQGCGWPSSQKYLLLGPSVYCYMTMARSFLRSNISY